MYFRYSFPVKRFNHHFFFIEILEHLNKFELQKKKKTAKQRKD